MLKKEIMTIEWFIKSKANNHYVGLTNIKGELIEDEKDFFTKICVICKKPINSAYGHNAEPIKKGRCCDYCNAYKVVPKRIENMMENTIQKLNNLKQK